MTLHPILDMIGVPKCGVLQVCPTNQDSQVHSPNPQ